MEVDRELLRRNRESCQQLVDAHLSLLPDERVIFEQVMDAVRNERPLLMYLDGQSGRGKTVDEGHHCRSPSTGQNCPVHGLAVLNYKGDAVTHFM